MASLAERVLHFIRERGLLRAGDRVGAAVSGGADSVALLRLLLELRLELGVAVSVVHLNHGIRGAAADEDAAFVARLAAEHDLALHAESADAPKHARRHHLGLEAAGRELRYGFFARLVREGKLTRVATGHTADDQAETVLLRLMRGAGTRGLAGIWPARDAHDGPPADAIVRPLLGTRRADLEQYLRDLGQPWREDASNRELKFARNRVRHQLLPLLEQQYNPGIVGVLGNTAETARAEEEYWNQRVAGVLLEGDAGRMRPGCISLALLATQPLALQRRLVRALAEQQGRQIDFDHVEQVLGFALSAATRGATLELPGGLWVRRTGRELRFDRGRLRQVEAGYHYQLLVPGEVEVRELRSRIRALLLPAAAPQPGYNPEQFLDPRSVAPQLVVRNWRAGDRFWPAHTKAPKKVKELLQERRIVRPQRGLWPVVASGEEIVWMRGFAAAKAHRASSGDALVIEELPLET